MDQLATFRIGRDEAGRHILRPIDQTAEELIARHGFGDKIALKEHRGRYPEHHRLVMGALSKIAKAKGEPVEVVLTWLKCAMGRVDFIKLPNGKVVAAPQSIAFDKMDQTEFQRWWDEAWRLISEHILPGVDQAAFDEIVQMVGGKNV